MTTRASMSDCALWLPSLIFTSHLLPRGCAASHLLHPIAPSAIVPFQLVTLAFSSHLHLFSSTLLYRLLCFPIYVTFPSSIFPSSVFPSPFFPISIFPSPFFPISVLSHLRSFPSPFIPISILSHFYLPIPVVSHPRRFSSPSLTKCSLSHLPFPST